MIDWGAIFARVFAHYFPLPIQKVNPPSEQPRFKSDWLLIGVVFVACAVFFYFMYKNRGEVIGVIPK